MSVGPPYGDTWKVRETLKRALADAGLSAADFPRVEEMAAARPVLSEDSCATTVDMRARRIDLACDVEAGRGFGRLDAKRAIVAVQVGLVGEQGPEPVLLAPVDGWTLLPPRYPTRRYDGLMPRAKARRSARKPSRIPWRSSMARSSITCLLFRERTRCRQAARTSMAPRRPVT